MFRELVVAKHRMEDEHKRQRWAVWHIAALGRVKEMPSLDVFLGRATTPKQNVTQQRAMLQMLSDTYKLPLRKTRLVPVHG